MSPQSKNRIRCFVACAGNVVGCSCSGGVMAHRLLYSMLKINRSTMHSVLCTKDVHPKWGEGAFQDENEHGGGGVWRNGHPLFS